MDKKLVEIIATECQMTKKKSTETLKELFHAIASVLDSDDKISFNKFGTFSAVHHKETTAFSPATREKVFVPPRITPHFKVHKSFKGELNG